MNINLRIITVMSWGSPYLHNFALRTSASHVLKKPQDVFVQFSHYNHISPSILPLPVICRFQ